MADKVVVQPDEERIAADVGKKKKRSKCCTCLIVFAIVSIVLLAVVIGVGWFFGDKYSQKFFGMSLGDTLGVFGDLYWTDDDDVVSRKYSDKDIDGFYNELKRNVLLRSDVEIDVDAAILEVLNKYLSDGGGDNAENNKADGGGDSSSETKPSTEDEKSGTDIVMDVFADMLQNVYKSENIDIERLKAYDAENNDTYIFELKDKQLAALCNTVLKAMLADAANIDFLSGVNEYIPLAKTVKLKQVKYVVQAVKDEQGNKTPQVAADITVWLGLQDAASSALDVVLKDAGFGWASGFVGWLGDVILPENVYVTVTVPLQDGAEPKINFNTMNAAERKRMYKLVNGVFKNIIRNDITVEGILNDFAGKIKPYLAEFSEHLDFSFAGSGTIGMDVIGMAANMLSKSEFKDDPLRKSDLMYMLQALLTTTPNERLHELEPYLYREWYADAKGENAVYRYDDKVDVTGKTKIDYGRELITAIENAYALDFGETTSVADALKLLGISFDGETQSSFDTSAVLDKIDKVKLAASLDPSSEIKKLKITDRMLVSLLSEQLESMLKTGDSGLGNLSVELDALTFVRDALYEDHTFALAAVSVGIEDMLKNLGDNKFIELLSGLLPEKILVSLQVDITLSLEAGDAYVPAQFMINNYERTQAVLDTIKKLVPDFDLAELTEKMENALRDTVGSLDELMGVELVRSDLAQTPVISGALVMPDIYTTVVKTVLTPENGDRGVVTNEELRSVLYELNKTDDFDDYAQSGDRTDGDLRGFIAEITDKYYLNPSNELVTLQDLTDFITLGEQKDFGTKFRVAGTTVGVKYVAYDTRTIKEITPLMTGAQLGAIIKQEIDGMEDIKDLFSLLDVQIASDSIKITMSVDIAALLPETVEKLMTADAIYINVTVKLLQVYNGAYMVDYAINSMGDSDTANLMKILDFLGDSFDVDAKTAEFGKILYEKMQSLRDSLGSDDLLRFTDGGIELASFYEFLSVKLDVLNDNPAIDNEKYAQTVKNAVQGMFERPVDPVSGEYLDEIYGGADESLIKNYRMSDFIFNAPQPDFTLDIGALAGGGSWTDREFNAWFQAALQINDSSALQTAVLTAGDIRPKATSVREWVNGKMLDNPADISGDHVIVSFKMPMGKFSDSADSQENTDTASGFLPQYMCATIALDKAAGTGEHAGKDVFVCMGTGINNMSVEEYNLIVRLMGLSPESEDENKVNLKSMTKDCVNQINRLLSYGTIDFIVTAYEADGVGRIKVTPTLAP